MPDSLYFGLRYEQESMDSGVEYIQQETGDTIEWWFFNAAKSSLSPTYDEASMGGDLFFDGPLLLPVWSTQRIEGAAEDNAGSGLYVTDTVRILMNYRQAVNAGLRPEPDQTFEHLRDRIVWDGQVWAPRSIVSTARVSNLARNMVEVRAMQVKSDELVNDPQFAAYAEVVDTAARDQQPPLPDVSTDIIISGGDATSEHMFFLYGGNALDDGDAPVIEGGNA